MNWHKREQHLEDVHDVAPEMLGNLTTEEQRGMHTHMHRHVSAAPAHDHPEGDY